MINLLMAIHCHQPVGNFDNVVEEAYQKSYLPFIELLEKHPKVKLSLHYSGYLIDWFAKHHPDFLKRIKSMVKNSQVEILAGGHFEPIFSMIPERDAIGQVRMLKDAIRKAFSQEPNGAWLAERVWEPKLPAVLSHAGIKFTIIDDSHFSALSEFSAKEKNSKFNPDDLNGYYITEELGEKVFIFPGSEKLRYYMPFKLPQETINYLRENNRNGTDKTITFADDGEKFGLWPGTNKWVYEEKWLDNFFTALEQNSDWIRLCTFSEHLKNNKPTERIYLSCASYREMLEWSGGFFRNFLIKYPEANNLHKKMLYVSNKISSVENNNNTTAKKKTLSKELTQARRHLYMGQTNDIYWHGVFGGLYLNHLRLAVSKHLIEAEKIVDKIMNDKTWQKIETVDYDCDGSEEVIFNTDKLNTIFKPSSGAVLSSWDYRERPASLINTLHRRYESYHEKIKESFNDDKEEKQHDGQPASIHDVTEIKQDNLDDALIYDKYNRYCLIDHFLSKEDNLKDFEKLSAQDKFDCVRKAYDFDIKKNKGKGKVAFNRNCNSQNSSLQLKKVITIDKACLNVSYNIKNLNEHVFSSRFGIEFNFSVYDPKFVKARERKSIDGFSISDSWNGLKIDFKSSNKFNLWSYPVETVSQTEGGIDKAYQNLCLLVWWDLDVKKDSNWESNIGIEIN